MNWAWAAGFYEGEGSITIQNSHNGRRRYAQMSCTQKDREPLEDFLRVVKAGSIYFDKTGSGCWRWRCTVRADVERILERMAKYLSQRRCVQAVTALAGSGGGPYQ